MVVAVAVIPNGDLGGRDLVDFICFSLWLNREVRPRRGWKQVC
jgi:hypothetical protein